MSDLELEHLRLLHRIHAESRQYVQEYDERREDFVLDLLDSGSSLRVIAEAIGVGTSTVKNWADNARRRRSG